MKRQPLHWSPWHRGSITPEQERMVKLSGGRVPDEIRVNNLYEVWITRGVTSPAFPELIWLSIKRRDKAVIRDWRELQRIKSELVGAEHDAVELFPAESRHVDAANQYHLWVLADSALRFPFGFDQRLVQEKHADTGDAQVDASIRRARQQPFGPTHQPPDDRQALPCA